MTTWLRQYWRLAAVGLVALVAVAAVGADRYLASTQPAIQPKPVKHVQRAAAQTQPDKAGVDCSQAKCIALTFDDGPGDYTPRLLDILEDKQVKATFFVWGGKYDGKALLQRADRAGMEIGNHTWHHKHLKTLSASEVRWEINQTADSIEQAIGKRPTLFRPPFGQYNSIVKQAAADEGEAIIMWNVDPEDWRHHSAAELAAFVAQHAKRNGIVDLHERQRTADALPQIIDELSQQGYTFVTVSQLLGADLQPGQVYGLD